VPSVLAPAVVFDASSAGGQQGMNATILWVLAAILVIVGIVQLLQGQVILGIVLIIAACLVGPGGYSVFNRRRA
jgi:TM2 domain-containing membrane protein YozV